MQTNAMTRQERAHKKKKGKASYYNSFNGTASGFLNNFHLALGLQILQLIACTSQSRLTRR